MTLQEKIDIRKQKANELHHSGYNCAQAVACSFAEELGYEKTEIYKICEAFGSGMAVGSTCGAASAMAIVVGMKNSDGNPENPTSKRRSYALIKKAMKKFVEVVGSEQCKTIKGIETGQVLRSCKDCVTDAAGILEEIFDEES